MILCVWTYFLSIYCVYRTIEIEHDLLLSGLCIYYLTVYILYISRVNKQHTPSYFFFASDNVYQLFAQSRWFSPGTPTSSTT
jgi:hypothetical protein